MGFHQVPWFRLTVLVLGIYALLTMLVCFYRTDFINLTIITWSFYVLINTEEVKKTTFRTLVLGIVISWVYDLMWLFLQNWTEDFRYDGGAELGIRKFALFFSYISFFFRILVVMVFWKDSMDFNEIIKSSGISNVHSQPSSQPAAGGGAGIAAPSPASNRERHFRQQPQFWMIILKMIKIKFKLRCSLAVQWEEEDPQFTQNKTSRSKESTTRLAQGWNVSLLRSISTTTVKSQDKNWMTF